MLLEKVTYLLFNMRPSNIYTVSPDIMKNTDSFFKLVFWSNIMNNIGSNIIITVIVPSLA